jgi:hypothetical protein
MGDQLADLRQQQAEAEAEQAELDRVIDLDELDRETALRELHAEADEDNPVVWRRSS